MRHTFVSDTDVLYCGIDNLIIRAAQCDLFTQPYPALRIRAKPASQTRKSQFLVDHAINSCKKRRRDPKPLALCPTQ